MDPSLLPTGLRAALSAAGRTLAAALASPALTGPHAVAAVTGASAGLVSRWLADHYPEAPTVEAAALLEAKAGVPAYAAAFAALTGHRLVAMADDMAGDGPSPHHFAAAAYRAAATLHEIHEDGRVSPREARAMLGDLGELSRLVADLSAAMARLAEGGR